MASIEKRNNTYYITVSGGFDHNGKRIRHRTKFVPDPDLSPAKQRRELERFVFEFEDKVKFVKINIDESPELAQKYFVMSIPTLKFIDNAEVKGSFVGAMAPDELEEWVDERL